MQSMIITSQGARALMVRTARNENRFILRGQDESAARKTALEIRDRCYDGRNAFMRSTYGMFIQAVGHTLDLMRMRVERDAAQHVYGGTVCELGSGAKLYHTMSYQTKRMIWMVSGYAGDGRDVKCYSRYAMDVSQRKYKVQPHYYCMMCGRYWQQKQAVISQDYHNRDTARCAHCHASLYHL